MNILAQRLLLLGMICLYLFLFNWFYLGYVVIHYDYAANNNIAPSFITFEWLFFLLLAILPILWMPVSLEKVSTLYIWVLYYLVYIPSIIIPYYTIDYQKNNLVALNLCLFFSMVILHGFQSLPLLRFPPLHFSPLMFIIALLVVSFVFNMVIFSVFGFKINMESIIDVYDVRAEFKLYTSTLTKYAGYMIGWQANVINLILIGYGLFSKRSIFLRSLILVVGVLGQLYIFSITGFKSVLFSIALIIVMLSINLVNRRLFGILFSLVIIVLISVSMFLVESTSSLIPIALTKRVLVTPGLLTGFYYEFFSNTQPLYLSYSLFEGLVHYPFHISPPSYLIGEAYFSNVDNHANVNLWGNGYANFYYFGIFLFTGLLGLVFWIMDGLSTRKNVILVSLFLSSLAFMLTNSSLITTLSTHGLIFALIILYLMPEESDAKIASKKL